MERERERGRERERERERENEQFKKQAGGRGGVKKNGDLTPW